MRASLPRALARDELFRARRDRMPGQSLAATMPAARSASRGAGRRLLLERRRLWPRRARPPHDDIRQRRRHAQDAARRRFD